MLKVSIFKPVVKKTLFVIFPEGEGVPKASAVLLGAGGEQLKKYVLPEAANELSLDEFAAGSYTLRVETGSEVLVKQIIIP